MKNPRIRYVPFQPHCFSFGGFDLQMLSALKAVRKYGVDAKPLDPWSRDFDFDILHCWGFDFANYFNILFAIKAGKKVVCTALIGGMTTINDKLRFRISSYIKKARFLLEMAEMLDALVVVNETGHFIANKYFKVPKNKIHIIPHIIDEHYYNQDADTTFTNKYNIRDYVLTSGNVCERKNQINLANACTQKSINLVVIGDVLDGEQAYGEKLAMLAMKAGNIKWIKGFPAHSPLLVSAYKNCSVFALPSHLETQPISALEAAALNKPLLLADKQYAHQKYYKNACLVHPDSIEDIATGLIKVYSDKISYLVPRDILEECRESFVGKSYAAVYEKL
jgi:glycosyltransferase involved in cell wall biosynthesis